MKNSSVSTCGPGKGKKKKTKCKGLFKEKKNRDTVNKRKNPKDRKSRSKKSWELIRDGERPGREASKNTPSKERKVEHHRIVQGNKSKDFSSSGTKKQVLSDLDKRDKTDLKETSKGNVDKNTRKNTSKSENKKRSKAVLPSDIRDRYVLKNKRKAKQRMRELEKSNPGSYYQIAKRKSSRSSDGTIDTKANKKGKEKNKNLAYNYLQNEKGKYKRRKYKKKEERRYKDTHKAGEDKDRTIVHGTREYQKRNPDIYKKK
tara:strand:- start:77 stop:853 length:777 start_codon:yes stop_codon:yes gene_type:complete